MAPEGYSRLLGFRCRFGCKASHLSIQTRMQALTESKRQLKDALICSEYQDVASGVEYRRANFAMFQVLLYLFQLLSRESSIQKTGDMLPNVFAVYNHGNHFLLALSFFNSGTRAFVTSSEPGVIAL
jgi:hypothetical protein